ncbi:phenolphthiocerol synthesis polyketide synthase type I Pks15/1 domain protein [Mycobacterium kansasii]|uniref:Phenolphthiocerol synthesis polyketide synthase type I Pks15/1 domain protein n=1 Tax=Mycobacterium kansasii TaxID=1768 RepID=A0A1V3WB27_MYCKA|nr:phenolphthiocerol synthesis polyketide synthase type I Pks15/1 domain protein [Mycobacterium kansasii]
MVGDADGAGSRTVSVYSTRAAGDSWVLHADGVLRAGGPGHGVDLSVWPPVGASAVDMTDVYERLSQRGYGYGPAFRGLRAVWRRGAKSMRRWPLPRMSRWRGLVSTRRCWIPRCMPGVRRGCRPVGAAVLLAGGVVAGSRCVTGPGAHHPGRRRFGVGGAGRFGGLPVLSVRELAIRPVSGDALSAAALAAGGVAGDRLLELAWSPITLGRGAPTPGWSCGSPKRVPVVSPNAWLRRWRGCSVGWPMIVAKSWWC